MPTHDTPESMRNRLLDLIRKRAYREGDFVLSSGARSSYYINGKKIANHSECAYLIGEVLFEHLRSRGIDFDTVGGLAVGALPITTALAIACHRHGREVEGFFVRNERKEHGTRDLVEGEIRPGAKVVILEDVVTSGRSAQKAIDAAAAAGGEVVCVASLVDREEGAAAFFEQAGIRYEPLFTRSDLKSRAGAG